MSNGKQPGMKKPFLSIVPLGIVVLLIGLAACQKTNSPAIAGVYGQWKWVRTDWTFTTQAGTARPDAFSTTVLNVEKDQRFTLSQNGQQLADSTIAWSQDCPNGVCDTLLTFNNTTPQSAKQSYYWPTGKYAVTLRHDSLVLTYAGLITPAGASSVMYFIPN